MFRRREPQPPPAARPCQRAAHHGAVLMLALAAAALSGPLEAQDGLQWRHPAGTALVAASDAQEALRLRLGKNSLRLDVDVLHGSSGVQRARLLGDYFLTGPGFGQGDVAGGLRLTSGVMVGPAQDTANLPPPRLLGGAAQRPLGPTAWREPDGGQRVALPYIGLGYTSASARDGWGLSADIGLGGMRPGERLRLGQAQGTAAQAERVLNDLRLAPVIQLGVSYAF